MVSVRALPFSFFWPAASPDEHVINHGPGLYQATVVFSEIPVAGVVATVTIKDGATERVIAACQGRAESQLVVFSIDGAATIRVSNSTGPVSINAIPKFG